MLTFTGRRSAGRVPRAIHWIAFAMIAAVSGFSTISAKADIVVEQFFIGDPFFDGMVGTNPGDQQTFDNQFASGPSLQGRVRLRSPLMIDAGFGDVRFKANSGFNLSRVDFDLGPNYDVVMLPNGELISTQFTLAGIDSDPDADLFSFEVSGLLEGGVLADAISDFDISITDATYTITSVDEAIFRVEVTNTGATASSITFSSSGATELTSLSFREITVDVAADQLVASASRTVSSVPEPTTIALMGMVLLGGFVGRRRIA